MTQQANPINYRTEWLIAEAAGRRHVLSVLEQIRSSFGIEGRDVLELGCGIGTNLQVFAPTNRIRGVEGLESAAREAERRGIPTLRADLEQSLPLADASADWILCIDVLEHLANAHACLREAVRVLRPNGRIVINVPNHFDWRGRMRIARGSGIDSQRYFPDSPAYDYPHLRFFRHADARAMAESCGLAIERDYSPHFATVPKAAVLARLGLQGTLRGMARSHPDLLCGGFFFVLRREGRTG